MLDTFAKREKILDAIAKMVEDTGKADDTLGVDDDSLPVWAESFADYIYELVQEELSNNVFCDYRKIFSGTEIGYLYKGKYYVFLRDYAGPKTAILPSKDNHPPKFFVPIDNADWTGENELIQYIIVNQDLGMSPGKIGAQVGHACTDCAIIESGRTLFNLWYKDCQKKVVLEAHEKDMRKILEMGIGYQIIDKGLTEIPPNSLTCISLGVMTRKIAEKYTKRLQLLK